MNEIQRKSKKKKCRIRTEGCFVNKGESHVRSCGLGLIDSKCEMPQILSNHFPLYFLNNLVVSTDFASRRCLPLFIKQFVHTYHFLRRCYSENLLFAHCLRMLAQMSRESTADGLKNPQQLQPFLITQSCSVSAGFYSLQVSSNLITSQKHNAACRLSNTVQFMSWPLTLICAK